MSYPDELLRPDEVADLMHVSRSKVYTLIASGRLPHVRVFGSVRVPQQALLRLIEASTVAAEAPMGGR